MSSSSSSLVVTNSLSSRHFYPKFENLNVRPKDDPLLLMTPQDIMLVTKKHSGSLILVYSNWMHSRWELVVNSKNGTNNEFSITAEHYFRYQFEGAFGNDWEAYFQEFVDYLGMNSMTCCFEFVTDVLGDHGAKPLLPYAVLTAITQFNDTTGQSRFAGLPEIVEIAYRFRLILNEMWVIGYVKAIGVSNEIRGLRWHGYDEAFTTCLDANYDVKVYTMLPHCDGQGQLLEGMVVQIVRTSSTILNELSEISRQLLQYREPLMVKLRQFRDLLHAVGSGQHPELQSFCKPDDTGSISNVQEFFITQSNDTPLGQLFRHLSALPQNTLRFFSLKRVKRGHNISVILHVHKDDIFFGYAANKPVEASQLYRGMEVFLQREQPQISTGIDVNSVPISLNDVPIFEWDIIGISKWKNWRYLKRTFGMRNGLSVLFRNGIEAYSSYIVKQFQNWGLPEDLHKENMEYLLAWGEWLLSDPHPRAAYMRSSSEFGYLAYVDQFQVLFDTNALQKRINLGKMEPERTRSRKNIAILAYLFQETLPVWIKERILSGYTVIEKHEESKKKTSKVKAYEPGSAYILTQPFLPKADDVLFPHIVVIIPPADTCMDRRLLKMHDALKFNLSDSSYTYPVLTLSSEDDAEIAASRINSFEQSSNPTCKVLLALVGLPPGSGKSTMSAALVQAMEATGGLTVRIVSSDYFGMKLKAGSTAAKTAFEEAVVSALRDPSVNVVIYDKNIPNIEGYHCMQSVCSRAGLSSLVIIPIVPNEFGCREGDICLTRVMARRMGSHTLTSGTTIDGYSSTTEFIQNVFINQCKYFIPVAKLLPRAIIIDGLFDEDNSLASVEVSNESGPSLPSSVRSMAQQVVNTIVTTLDDARSSTTNAGSVNTMGFNVAGSSVRVDLTQGRFLALCFSLDKSIRGYFESLVNERVRELPHITILFYSGRLQEMAEAAVLVSTLDVASPVPVTLHRLAIARRPKLASSIVASSEVAVESTPTDALVTAAEQAVVNLAVGSRESDDCIIWASASVPGWDHIPCHATLHTSKFPAVLAKSGEQALREGKQNLVIPGTGETLSIQCIEIDSIVVDSWWTVCT